MDSTNVETGREITGRRSVVPNSMIGFFMSLLIIILLVALGYTTEKTIGQRLDTAYLNDIVNTSFNNRLQRHFPVYNNSQYFDDQPSIICNHVFIPNGQQFYICQVPRGTTIRPPNFLVNQTNHVSLRDWNCLQNSTLFINRLIYR